MTTADEQPDDADVESPLRDVSADGPTGWSLVAHGAHMVAGLGASCKALIDARVRSGAPLPSDDYLRAVVDELGPDHFDDEEAALILEVLLAMEDDVGLPELDPLRGWLRAHPHEPRAVIECLRVVPPRLFKLKKLLSTAGSQKLVFLGEWSLRQRAVVLKKYREPSSPSVERELHNDSLVLDNEYIVTTHHHRNDLGEEFLVESLIEPLHDEWRASGIEEAANLLAHVGHAVSYLHRAPRLLVHGDVKPDNIGKEDDKFKLLDFGVCRPEHEFKAMPSATGSLRTRAPELLCEGQVNDPFKVDVWALCATVFNALVGRFPLFEDGEYRSDGREMPRVWDTEERAALEDRLRQRANDEWERLVEGGVATLDPRLRAILAKGLARDPNQRWTSDDLLDRVRTDLTAYLHRRVEAPLSRRTELEQLVTLIPAIALEHMPQGRRAALRDRLEVLMSEVEHPELVEPAKRLISLLDTNAGA